MSAYHHSAIEEEIYLKQPQAFVKRRQNGETIVCKLKKSIYGLKQAAKNWYEALANLLISSGFTVEIPYIPTEDMTADISTKSLPRIKVEKHRYVLLGN